jgi:Phage integrase, N-terminal SAM-like domain
VTRQSYQQGYISEPIQTRQGIAFKIRYRVRTQSGKWQHRRETLYGLSGRKAARAVLEQRIQSASTVCPEVNAFTIRGFVETYWRPYLDRQRVKLSTRATYESALNLHILPAFGDSPLRDVIPLQIENFVQSKLKSGLSSKTARNLLVLLQGIFSLALDNDLIEKSPKHAPLVRTGWVHGETGRCESKA